MAKENVLIVEDDVDLAYITKAQLKRRGFEVSCAADYRKTAELLKNNEFDVVLLDMKLPDGNGLDLCMQIRKKTVCPIIFTSCIGDKETILSAFRKGADDYIIKPFDPDLLAARIYANLRRTKRYFRTENGRTENKYFKNYIVERSVQQLWKFDNNTRQKELIHLSPTEYKLLELFIENENVLITYEEIYRCIWETESNEDFRTVMVHVSNLRKKINTAQEKIIKTVRMSGYIFQVESPQAESPPHMRSAERYMRSAEDEPGGPYD